MIYAGILAAGVGERMHRQDLPKQFLNLGSKPIICHTLEQFYVNPQIDKIIVVAPEMWKQYTEDLIARYDTFPVKTTVITGGANKTISVERIVGYILANSAINNDDILLTHDAVRPFVTQRLIDENIETTQKFGAASTVMTTNDTIVVSNNGVTLQDIPPKNCMFAEQTPQTFNLKILDGVFKKAKEQNISLHNETELARLYIRHGNIIRFVNGEYFNMKIINPYDLEVAEALLKERFQ